MGNPIGFCFVMFRLKGRLDMETVREPAPLPILNIIGQRVALGPYNRELLPFDLKWVNDFEVTRHFHERLAPWTKERREAHYERYSQGGPDPAYFTVYERETLRPIGFTYLEAIDHLHRTATFGILLGEKDCWGKGYGTETTRLMLDYAFTLLRLQRPADRQQGQHARRPSVHSRRLPRHWRAARGALPRRAGWLCALYGLPLQRVHQPAVG